MSITRYHCPFYPCTGCKKSFCAPLPKEISHRSFGPRFEAMISLMTGEYHLSKRQVAKMVKDLFGLTIASSTVSNIEKRARGALEKAYLAIKSYLKQQPYKGVDETSWRDRGLTHYIWVASTDDAVCFSINPLYRTIFFIGDKKSPQI